MGALVDEPGEGEIRDFLAERIAAKLTGEEVDPDRPLEEYGLSSRDAVAIAGELADLLGRELSPTLIWAHPTINQLARVLTAGAEVKHVERRHVDDDEPIAVIGVGCRVPGAHGPAEFWRLLMAGRDAVGVVPEGRWAPFDDGSAAAEEVLARTTRHGGFLDDIAGFDAEFFGIAPGEAATMDPQQRLLLETAWEALEHGGLAPRSLRGSRTGAFVGISGNEYAYLTTAEPARVDAWTATGAAFSIAANRLSYLLDLRGPSLAVDTACSSSLVAAHLAVRSLRSGESDLALAAGVNLLLSPVITMAFDQGGGTSPDGRCKAFDAAADGMVRAEGCGVVVLKRLSDAVADGDRVLAVITGSGVNQDGRSNGLVAPNPEAQEALLREVYAGRPAPDYIEAHGTGTFLGDPIEARAIAATFSERVLIGSAKSNLGHLEAAAGVTGLIKTVLAVHHGVIPPSIHFKTPNPHIPWDTLAVVTEPTPWPSARRGAGVSSFGFGGTNAHLALVSANAFPGPAAVEARGWRVPAPRVAPDSADWTPAAPAPEDPGKVPRQEGGGTAKHVFVVSDVSADRVREYAEALAAGVPECELADVAHTLARRAGRGRMAAAVVAGTAAELAEGLGRVQPVRVPAGDAGPVWVFSGYGSQWAGMGRELYRAEPAFRRVIDEVAPLLRAEAGIELWDPAEGVAETQPVIFAVQVALAALWRAYGIEPAAVIGHSMGEVAAAVVAGGLGLRDGVRVVCRRARLLGTLGGGGAMAVLEVGAEEVPRDLHVAVYSSPRQTVVTGDPRRVAEFAAEVAERGLLARTLTAEGAGHSPQVTPLLPLIRSELAAISPGRPALPYFSTVLEDPWETPTFEAAYWAAGVRRPVRLAQAVRAAADAGFAVFTEVSPHPLLGSSLRDTLGGGALVTHSLRREGEGEFHAQLAAVAAAVTPRTRGKVVDLPPVPWRHARHWAAPRRRAAGHRLLGAHVETPAGHSWSTTLDDLADAPWRLDPADWHRHGHPVLPAVAVARLAHAAARAVYGAAELSDVAVHALLPLPARVTVTLAGERVEVSAKNAAGAWIRYGTATVGPSTGETPPWLEKVGTVGVDGALRGIETCEVPAVPVPLDGKLVERAWVPAPLVAGPSREWLILADEGDPRAARHRAPVLLVPRNLDAAGVERLILRVADLATRSDRLTIVTHRAQAVLDGETPDPGPAALRGLIRVLAFEHPELHATLVDVDDLDTLDRELAGDGADDEVAWRGGVRYAARLRRAGLPPVRQSAVAGPGGYVITGGYGTLGLAVARWLAARGATRIVLNGRSTPPPERLEGLPVVVVTGDLAEPGTAERLVRAATEGGLPLRGVVHAAGVLDDRLVADLDADSLRRVWTAKVHGGLNLHEATKEAGWWVGFSSAAALLGSPGQAAYAAANAWLDALCELRRSEGLAAITVNWGTWAGAAALPAVEPLTHEEGIEALEALLQRDLSAGVVKLDPAQAITIFPEIGRMPYFSEVVERGPEELGPEDVPGRVRERAAAVLGVDLVWLDDGSVLTELGLDSLAATRLRGMIEYDFGVAVPAAPLLNGGTLGELTLYVTGALGLVDAGPPAAMIGPRDAAERQAVRVLTTLLGREPSVTEIVAPDVIVPALDQIGGELGRPVERPDGPVTVAGLADAIRAVDEVEAELGIVRPLNGRAGQALDESVGGRSPSGHSGGRPLFLAHPAGGTTGVYALLAGRLGVPVFGLERIDDAGLDIPERAARYVAEIRRTCAGPYRVGGWSFGGILAFEIARQLGDECEVVVMIDAGLPDEVTEEARREIHARRYVDFAGYLGDTYGVRVALDLDELLPLDEQGQLDLAEERIAASGVIGMLSPAILRHQITSHEDTRAIERYRAQPYQGRVVLYRSTEPTPWAVEDARYAHRQDPARGFGEYSPGLEIVEIPGSHHLNLLDPPHVEIVADHLEELL